MFYETLYNPKELTFPDELLDCYFVDNEANENTEKRNARRNFHVFLRRRQLHIPADSKYVRIAEAILNR